MEEALVELRSTLGLQLQWTSLQARGRALGEFHVRVGLCRGVEVEQIVY